MISARFMSLRTAIQQIGWDMVQVAVVSDGLKTQDAEESFADNPILSIPPERWGGYSVEGAARITSERVFLHSSTAELDFPQHRNVRLSIERLHARTPLGLGAAAGQTGAGKQGE